MEEYIQLYRKEFTDNQPHFRSFIVNNNRILLTWRTIITNNDDSIMYVQIPTTGQYIRCSLLRNNTVSVKQTTHILPLLRIIEPELRTYYSSFSTFERSILDALVFPLLHP